MSDKIRKNWVVLAVAVGMLTVTAAAVFYPQHRELEELTERIEQQRATLEGDIEAARRLPELIDEVEDMKRRYRNFDRRLPKRQELGEFLREITVNLPTEKLVSDRIEPGNPKREELFQTLPIRMQLRGKVSVAGELSAPHRADGASGEGGQVVGRVPPGLRRADDRHEHDYIFHRGLTVTER